MNPVTSHRLHSIALRSSKIVSFVAFVSACSMALTASAQFDTSSIAKTYIISGDKPASGDIVSFNPTTQKFLLSQGVADPNAFGIVVDDPAVVLRSSADGVPLVTSGEVYVNVTTANGPILAGDLISVSAIPGKGQKAAGADAHVIGTALESFPSGATNTPLPAGASSVYSGHIRSLLHIGSRAPAGQSKAGEASGAGLATMTSTGVPAPIATLIKYLLAAAVVAGTIYVAFRNFGSNMRDSIVSIGRNPLAKSSIQTMVIINTTLIVLVSAVGLFVGFMILFVPI